jgi:hypothetical protein
MRKFILELSQNAKALLPDVIKIYLPSCLFLLLVWSIGKVYSIDSYELTADPAELAGLAPYAGLISNVGILLWCGAAAICLFSASLAKLDPICFRKWFAFLLASGCLTTVLLLDDMFQFHESYPALFFGLDADLPHNNRRLQNLLEAIFFVVYFASFIFYTFYFRKHIQRTEYLFLLMAFFLFGLSTVVDMGSETMKGHYIIEEGLKLLGIISWLTYFYRTCRSAVQQLARNLVVPVDKAHIN